MKIIFALILVFAHSLFPIVVAPQAVPYARTYAKPKDEVERALKELQAYSGQKLPIVEGFVGAPDKPLDRYERAFYQFSLELLPSPASGTIVQVAAKITAWYADKDPSKSGYQILPSNGRLELDLLDRLDEKFGNRAEPGSARALASSTISAPAPKLNLDTGLGSSLTPAGNSASPVEGSAELAKLKAAREAEEKRMRALSAELQNLEEVKKNQGHPVNLVSVKRTGTPVFARSGETERVLFKAAANDEFEYLDTAGDWVHIQISGVSRGYIRKSALELPETLAGESPSAEKPDTETKLPPAPFRITREESSIFPGTWEPLKGQTVKIYTVQPTTQDPKQTGAAAKLNFVNDLFRKFISQPTAAPDDRPTKDLGVVVIFDSADGGIAATTLETLQLLQNEKIPPSEFWKKCYLDPPEAFQSKP